MKRGKDEEKIMGPMFPRLHVNDADKGGPRAPPRNKMALYEQLTVPSDRYRPGVRPLNPTTRSNMVASASTSHGISRERSMFFPSQRPPVLPLYLDRRPTSFSNAVNSRFSAPQAEQRRKLEDGADFMVPIFSQQGREQSDGLSPGILRELPKDHDEETNQSDKGGPTSGESVQERDKDETVEVMPSANQTIKNAFGLTRREESNGSFEACANNRDHQDENKLSGHEHNNAGTLDGHVGNSSSCELLEKLEGRVPLRLKHTFGVGESNRNFHEIDRCDLNERSQRYFALSEDHLNRGHELSGTTVVDAEMGLDVSADDVVGIIGLKHFWKARRAIANQQRVFAVQVFELHRLIKVQRLIAGSPDLLINGSAFIAKPTLESNSIAHPKKFRTELAIKPVAGPTFTKHKEAPTNSNENEIKGLADSAVVGKAPSSIPSLQTVSTQLLTHRSTLVSSAPAPSPPLRLPVSASDVKMAPSLWPFPQPVGQQWLVPMMSPSEGLVYKPYPAPAFPGPVCGSCGPIGPTPLMGHYSIHQACGVPASHHHHYPHHHHHHHQGMGTTPHVVPCTSTGYFPPYGMPVMSPVLAGLGSAVDQINYQFSGSNLNGDTGQAISGPINMGTQQEGSCNGAGQRQTDVLGSTASSPIEKVSRGEAIGRMGPVEEKGGGSNALNLFPATQHMVGRSEEGEVHEEAGRPNQVIRVVPHNARSAPESAARIFQSIQEERRQQESS